MGSRPRLRLLYGRERPGAELSIYIGKQGDPSNREGWWNYLKDALIRSYQGEYEAKLRELNETILTPAKMLEFTNRVLAEANPAEAGQGAAPVSNTFQNEANAMRTFATGRQAAVRKAIPLAVPGCGARPARLCGRHRSSSTRAPPAPIRARTPSTPGRTAWPATTRPSFFPNAGTYPIALTLTVDGTAFTDEVVVTVIARPPRVFEEKGGVAVMEAESNHESFTHGETECWWAAESTQAGSSGASYMHAAHNQRRTFLSTYVGKAPELAYFVRFAHAGRVPRVGARLLRQPIVGLDPRGARHGEPRRHVCAPVPRARRRVAVGGNTRSSGPQELVVATAGIHTFSVWIRESGLLIDKIILTTDTAYVPEGVGPPESLQVPNGGAGSIRGEVNGDGKINISDPIKVLRHLFAEPVIACADHGDANDDGKLDIADAVCLLGYLFSNGPAPASPFPDVGYDETADENACGDGTSSTRARLRRARVRASVSRPPVRSSSAPASRRDR